MKTKQEIMRIAVFGMMIVLSGSVHAEDLLWYQQPANKWMEAIPEGNGRLSTMVYGGITHEVIALNEISMWSGQPDSTSNDLCGKEPLQEMRKCFFENNPEQGNALGDKYLNGRMTTYGTHVPFGSVEMKFHYPESAIGNYKRMLDMNNAITAVTFDCGGVKYKREYIVSYPDDVIAMHFTASRPGEITTDISLNMLQKSTVRGGSDALVATGKVDFPMHGKGGVCFEGMVRVKAEGGTVSNEGGTIQVKNADALTIFVDIRTDYGSQRYKDLCRTTIETALHTGYKQIKTKHICDYKPLYERMSIRLGDKPSKDLATDVRLKLIKSGAEDSDFDALFFQYGRYMLISSSRTHEGLPLCANLQGIWNDNMACNMPWTCDYHLDINIQQNYWSANRANLAECNEPLFAYLDLLSKHGAETARRMYGCRGWVAHTVCNIWGYTAPGWGVGWGMNVTGGAWLATHLWSHYQYTQDKEYLREKGYPLLKSVAEFFVDYMVTDPRTGCLVTGPSVSPENGYISERGNNLSLDMMPMIDREVVYDIYKSCIEASKILGLDKGFRKQIEKDIKRLPALKIGRDGQIQEWQEDVSRTDPSHRHSSHLLALFPFNQISYTNQPELVRAAEKSIQKQTASSGWEDTEWSTANMLCFSARLQNGEKAHEWLQNLFKKFTRENLMTVSPAGIAGAKDDIFSFDATEASVAGMCEMLLQSYDGVIDFLPALPKAWNTGEVKGLCAEGGLEVDMKWREGKMETAKIRAKADGVIKIKGMAEDIRLKRGETKNITF